MGLGGVHIGIRCWKVDRLWNDKRMVGGVLDIDDLVLGRRGSGWAFFDHLDMNACLDAPVALNLRGGSWI